ncbi:MAG: nicotinate-nucleotide adenylyltransferase [Proteobacteria bacterium]|nr:nicotinate-nucleotide adenylyltransferase [Pseudomonadota bacterium]MBU1740571.1 nicotinate-nucleotide adenylyltransferase [Pseudomonadota bacterium]
MTLSKPRHPVGVIHGRFQVFHNDHLKYVLAGADRCEHLYVGVTNPDPGFVEFDTANPERSQPENNPLTYFERYRMVFAALLAEGLAPADFSVVPLPINRPEFLRHYVPLDAVFFLTIYDGWGEKKLAMFQEMGLETEVMWRRPAGEKGITGGQVRRLIREGGDWESLVPLAVAEIVREIDLVTRLKT